MKLYYNDTLRLAITNWLSQTVIEGSSIRFSIIAASSRENMGAFFLFVFVSNDRSPKITICKSKNANLRWSRLVYDYLKLVDWFAGLPRKHLAGIQTFSTNRSLAVNSWIYFIRRFWTPSAVTINHFILFCLVQKRLIL